MGDVTTHDDVAARLSVVRASIEAARRAAKRADPVDLVAVTKTFDAERIRPLLAAGQRLVGENRVQEAAAKWQGLREEFEGIELHLIGPLQSNKARDAVALFDVIQTIDRAKIAEAIVAAADKAGRMPRAMVQVNIGAEPQKAGVASEQAATLVERCRGLGLSVDGLMAIPPVDEPPVPHFSALARLAAELGLATSMGMSGDYPEAIAHGARWVRVGSALFGRRPPAM